MTGSSCIQQARDMAVPHWGLQPTTAGSFVGDGEGSWHAEHVPMNDTNPPFKLSTSTLNGFQYNNITWSDSCGSASVAVPDGLPKGATPSAIVIKVTDMTNSNDERPFTMAIKSCDGSVSFNTTKPGVFVVKGAEAAVFVERWFGSVENKMKGCPGKASIAFSSAPLDDYCKVDATLAECKKTDKTDTTPAPSTTPKATSGSSSIKQSLVVSTVGILSVLAAALL